MKNVLIKLFIKCLLVAALGAGASQVFAADVYKANNFDNLNAATSWEGGTVPGGTDHAIWDSRVTASGSYNNAGNLAVGQLQIKSPGGKVTIYNNTITLNGVGGIGIDMSEAAQDLFIGSNIMIGSATQQWVLGGGRTLTIGAIGIANGSINTNNQTGLTITGTGNLTYSAANMNARLTLSNDNDFTGVLTLRGAPATLSGNGKLSRVTDLVIGTVYNSGLTIDNATAVNNRINTSANLILGDRLSGGGILAASGGAATQTLANLVVANGQSTINLNNSYNLIFSGNYQRADGVVKFVLANGANIAFSTSPTGAVTHSVNGTDYDILIGAALGNNMDDFVKVSAGNVVAAMYSGTTFASGVNTYLTGTNTITLSADSVTQSLKMGLNNANLELGGNTLTIESGGILVYASGMINSGTIRTLAGQSIWQLGEGNRNLTINAAIADTDDSHATNFERYGGGTTSLGGNNTFSGTIFFNGNLGINSVNALGSGTAAIVLVNGGGGLTMNVDNVKIIRDVIIESMQQSLSINTNGKSGTELAGSITSLGENTRNFSKQGPGTLLLSGTSPNANLSLIASDTGGQLQVTGVIINNNANTNLEGTGSITISGNGVIQKNGGSMRPATLDRGATHTFNIQDNGYLNSLSGMNFNDNHIGLSGGVQTRPVLNLNIQNSGSINVNGNVGISSGTAAIVNLSMKDNAVFTATNGSVGISSGPGALTVFSMTDASVFRTGGDVAVGSGVSSTTSLTMSGDSLMTTATSGKTLTFAGGSGATINLSMSGSSGVFFSGNVNIGSGASAVSNVSMTDNATFTATNNAVNIGSGSGAVTVFSMTNNAAFRAYTPNNLNIGSGANSITSMTLSGSSTFVTATMNAQTVFIGSGANSKASLLMTDSSTFRADYNFVLGDGSGFTASATLSGNSSFSVGNATSFSNNASNSTTNLTMTDTASLQSTGDINFGNGTSTNSVINFNIQDNALLKSNNRVYFAKVDSSLTTVNQTGGVVEGNEVNLNASAFASATTNYNFSGGIIRVGSMMYLGANSNLYLNSGTVQAKGSMTIKSANATATGTGNIYVQAGGGVIDTDSFTVTSSLAFQHDTSSLGSAKDGGLTKLGAGTLNLNVVNTYTGDTVIKGGTLITGVNGALGNTVVGFGNTSGTTGILNLNGISQQIGGLYGGDNYAGYVQNNTGSVVLTINSSGSTSFAGGILSGISIVKTGTGTQTLTGEINNYDGSTTVNQGTLLITGSGKIESTSGVTVNGGVFDYASSVVLDRDVIVDGGVFKYNSAAVYSGNLTFTSGVIGGNGNFAKALSIGAGQVIAPGNSAGNFKTGAQTWLTGGAYQWEISSLPGTAGTDWDLLTISGVLNLEGIDANGFSLLLSSLSDLSGFDSSQAYAWEIATASGGIVGFDVGKFLIDADGLSGFDPAGFSLYLDSSSLFLKYEMIPEPSTWGLLLAGAAMLTVGVLRRRKSTVKC